MEVQVEQTLQLTHHNGTVEHVTEDDIRAHVRAGRTIFEVMGKEGDVKSIWDPSKPVEVDAARAQFDTLIAKGYRAYRTNDQGDQGDQMRTFDPHAGRVIFIPAMQGG